MQIPKEWTFRDSRVAQHFDSHVREQLPWYDLVTGAVAHIVRHYLPRNGMIYDIGCSTGNIGKAVAAHIEARNATLVGVEESTEMCALYDGPGECVNADAATFRYEPFDVATCFLLLMFLSIQDRERLLRSLLASVKTGGVIVIVDKVAPPSGYIGTIMRRLTIAGKISAGVTAEDVIAKELSLSGVQRPLDAAFIKTLAPNAFEFFAFGEFAGWLIEAPEQPIQRRQVERI